MKKRLLSFLLTIVLCAGLFPAAARAADLPFVDVSPDAWYYNDVKNAVDTGLVNGKTATTYCPDDFLTYAEAVKLAACMNQKYVMGVVTLVNGDPWYMSYADYARMNGIIARDYDWNAYATRAGYMAIFAHALPDSALPAKNEVPAGSIPDVPETHPQADEIYQLYRAGILQGSDSKHSCNPDDNIKRSEVAAILTRMMFADKRISFSTGTAQTPQTETPKTEALKITKQPAGYALKAAEETVTFTVEISGGKAPYTYKWIVEKETGSNERTEGSDKLTSSFDVSFGKNSFADTKYVRVCVEVTDAAGTKVISEKAEVAPFTEGLKITKQPAAYALKDAGDIPSYSVTVSGGKAPYTVVWHMAIAGKTIESTYTHQSAAGTDEIKLTDASALLDGGNTLSVWCEVTDAAGTKVTSNKVELKPLAQDLRITKQPSGYAGPAGTTAKFELTVLGGTKPYKYDWQIYQDYIGWSGLDKFELKCTVDDEGTLQIPEISESLTLRCVVTDAAGQEAVSETVECEVEKSDLRIITQPSSVIASKGEKAEFEIAVSGGAKPCKFVWQYQTSQMSDWKDLSESGLSTFTASENGKLVVTVDTSEWWDAYLRCVVTDSYGSSVISNIVSISEHYLLNPTVLEFTKHPASFTAALGDTVLFEVGVSGESGRVDFRWEYKTGQMSDWKDLNESGLSTYTILANGTLKVTVDSIEWWNANLRCIATDASGQRAESFSATIHQP